LKNWALHLDVKALGGRLGGFGRRVDKTLKNEGGRDLFIEKNPLFSIG